jgi:hypothetical protein
VWRVYNHAPDCAPISEQHYDEGCTCGAWQRELNAHLQTNQPWLYEDNMEEKMAETPNESKGADWGIIDDYEKVGDEGNENIRIRPPIQITRWFNTLMIVINFLSVIAVTVFVPLSFGFMIAGGGIETVRDALVTWLIGGFLWVNTLVFLFGVYFIFQETIIDAIRRIRLMRRK